MELNKAYIEGFYADTPANRKLGRVGMSYAEYAEKTKSGDFKEVKESEEYLKEAKSVADSILNKGKIVNLWGREFNTLLNTLNKENSNLKSALVFVKNEDQYNLLSKKQNEVGSKIRFYRDLKRIADNYLKDEKNISIKDWLKQFVDNKDDKDNKNNKEIEEKAEKWSSAVKYKEDRELAKKAAKVFLQLGVELPILEHKPIPKQYNFQPISGYYKALNTIRLNSSLNITKKGKEYKEKGWNTQDNPILHELGHYLTHKMDPNSSKDFKFITKEDRDKIAKELSVYASWNQSEFNAELIAGILSGKRYSKEIMDFSDLDLNKDGKTPQEIFAPGIKFYRETEEMLNRVFKNKKNINSISKAYTEGIYADTPANRKLGRVGMSYSEYNHIIYDEENKTYYSFFKNKFDNPEEVLDWIDKYTSKFGGTLNKEESKNLVKMFEKRYELEGQGERILRGLINYEANKYGYSGGFDTNFGLYNINFKKDKDENFIRTPKENIYPDNSLNRKLDRVGMSYEEWNKRVKEEKEKNAEKKFYFISLPDGQEFMLEEGKTSKEKAIELAVDYATSMVVNNGYKEFKFNLEENIDSWSNEDLEDENKKAEWYSIKAIKHGDKVEISVFDFNDGKYIRNDTQKREERNFLQQQKRREEKSKQEFQEKFGWIEELENYFKNKK